MANSDSFAEGRSGCWSYIAVPVVIALICWIALRGSIHEMKLDGARTEQVYQLICRNFDNWLVTNPTAHQGEFTCGGLLVQVETMDALYLFRNSQQADYDLPWLHLELRDQSRGGYLISCASFDLDCGTTFAMRIVATQLVERLGSLPALLLVESTP